MGQKAIAFQPALVSGDCPARAMARLMAVGASGMRAHTLATESSVLRHKLVQLLLSRSVASFSTEGGPTADVL